MKYPLFLALLNTCALGTSIAAENPLTEHRWQHRLLIAFADSESNAHVSELKAAVSAAACELGDRDLLVGWSFAQGESRVGDELLSAQEADALRQLLPESSHQFTAILIGKDGGIKASYADVPALEEIFALIDGMPMRRSEMHSQPAPCN